MTLPKPVPNHTPTQLIQTEAELKALYDVPKPKSLIKVVDHLTPLYRDWISASQFVVLSTVGPEGTDGSPRGDAGPVVQIADDKTLLLPDWRGNNRIDTLLNIVRDGRISLMFMVPNENNVVRVNGRAVITTDEAFLQAFEHNAKQPRTVLVISIDEVYFQCAKAIMRAKLWSGEESPKVPSAGQFLKEVGEEANAKRYDAAYPAYAEKHMW